jgi:hypothetical protein
MKNIQFTKYEFDADLAKSQADGDLAHVPETHRRDTQGLSLTEMEWASTGKPYCKVYPAIADQLADVDMSAIPVSEFKLPFPVFEICLPSDRFASSILLWSCLDIFGLYFQVDSKHILINRFTAIPGKSIDQCMFDTVKQAPFSWQDKALWSIAISTSLFILNQHHLILPDLQPRLIRTRKPNGAKGDLRPAAAALTLGRDYETELPAPEYARSDDTQGIGREVSHSFMRRAHFRNQRCGLKLQDSKLIFIHPTIIRPDLPRSGHRHGYFIPDPTPNHQLQTTN